MTLRFEVDQAEAFRRGINVEKSTTHLDVNPAEISQEERNLIADRLEGIDVKCLELDGDGTARKCPGTRVLDNTKGRIVATAPTYEALIKAIRDNQAEIEKERQKTQEAANTPQQMHHEYMAAAKTAEKLQEALDVVLNPPPTPFRRITS